MNRLDEVDREAIEKNQPEIWVRWRARLGRPSAVAVAIPAILRVFFTAVSHFQYRLRNTSTYLFRRERVMKFTPPILTALFALSFALGALYPASSVYAASPAPIVKGAKATAPHLNDLLKLSRFKDAKQVRLSAKASQELKHAADLKKLDFTTVETITQMISKTRGVEAEAKTIQLFERYGDDAVKALTATPGPDHVFDALKYVPNPTDEAKAIKYLAQHSRDAELGTAIVKHGANGLNLSVKHGVSGQKFAAEATQAEVKTALGWSETQMNNAVGIRASAYNARETSPEAYERITKIFAEKGPADEFLNLAQKHRGTLIVGMAGTLAVWNHKELLELFSNATGTVYADTRSSTERVYQDAADIIETPARTTLWLLIAAFFGVLILYISLVLIPRFKRRGQESAP